MKVSLSIAKQAGITCANFAITILTLFILNALALIPAIKVVAGLVRGLP